MGSWNSVAVGLRTFYGVFLAASLTVMGCWMDVDTDYGEESEPMTEGLELLLDPSLIPNTEFLLKISKSIFPSVSMDPMSYQVTGVGPAGEFDLSTTETTVEIADLEPGTWSVAVYGKNADGDQIGYADAVPEVVADEVVTEVLVLQPIEGTGYLDLTVRWAGDDAYGWSLDGSVEKDGVTTALVFGPVEEGGGTLSATSLAELDIGYYTLTVVIYLSGVSQGGQLEALRIAAGQTSEGTVNF